MDCSMIKCPHCGESYLTILTDNTENCPVCKKPITIKITPAIIEVTKQEEKRG